MDIFFVFSNKLGHFVLNAVMTYVKKNSSITTKIGKWRKSKIGRIDCKWSLNIDIYSLQQLLDLWPTFNSLSPNILFLKISTALYNLWTMTISLENKYRISYLELIWFLKICFDWYALISIRVKYNFRVIIFAIFFR